MSLCDHHNSQPELWDVVTFIIILLLEDVHWSMTVSMVKVVVVVVFVVELRL